MTASPHVVGWWVPLFPKPERKKDESKAVARARRLAILRRGTFGVVARNTGRDNDVQAVATWTAKGTKGRGKVEVTYR